MATTNSIRAKLKTLLGTVSELAFVYDNNRASVEGYPAAIIDVIEERSEFLTNKENLRTVTFAIVIEMETQVKGLEAATAILDKAVNAVRLVIDNDFSLSGEVDWCIPGTGPRGQFQSPAGNVIFQQLDLECRFLFQT